MDTLPAMEPTSGTSLADAPQREGEAASPGPPGGAWDEAAVDRATAEVLGKRGPFRPLVRLLVSGDDRLVAKDYRGCNPLYRWTLGAWSLARESAALRRLDGLDGVPRFRGRVGRWIVLMSHFRGRDLGKVRRFRQTPEFFDRLMATVEAMHARGVVHLDLRQRRNILYRQKGAGPAILDFGSSLCLRPGSALHRWLARIDRSGVLKYKRRALPDGLSRDERRTLRRVERRRALWPFS